MLLTCLYTARVAGGPCYTILAKKLFLSAFFSPPWHLQQRSTAHPPKILQTPLGARGNCSDHSVPAAARWRWNCLLQWSRCNTNGFFFFKTHTHACARIHTWTDDVTCCLPCGKITACGTRGNWSHALEHSHSRSVVPDIQLLLLLLLSFCGFVTKLAILTPQNINLRWRRHEAILSCGKLERNCTK